jgi:hypothetical protein
MIEFLLALMSESPLLFVILLVNIVIMAYIIFRISLYIVHKKKPGQAFHRFVWRIKAKKGKEEMKTIEDVYAFIMEGIRNEGWLEKDEKPGFRSRKKVLKNIPEGDKRKFIEELFGLYEAKVYGSGRVRDEKGIVADILGRYYKL